MAEALQRDPGLLRGQRVVHQRGDQRQRHPPALARLGVDHPQLQVAARADRREQRGAVVVQIGQLGAPLARAAQPVTERQARRCVPRQALRAAHAQHRRIQHVPGPRLPRICQRGRSQRAGRVHPRPDQLPRRLPARRPALQQRRVGERPDQHRPQQVGQPPAVDVGVLGARIHAHLHGGGARHHDPAPRPAAAEVTFHRPVPRMGGLHPALAVQRIGAGARQPQALGGQRRPQHRLVGAQPRRAGGRVGGGRGAQLDLPAGFVRQPRAGREHRAVGRLGQHRQRGRHPGGIHRGSGTSAVMDEPLRLHPDQGRRPDLEADGAQVSFGRSLGQLRGRGHALCRIGRYVGLRWAYGCHRTHHPSVRDKGPVVPAQSAPGQTSTPLNPPTRRSSG